MARTPPLQFALDGPSRSQLKREAQALQRIGNDLLALPDAELERIAMDERLREALRTLRGIRSHEARRRQGQYIGKLLRESDPEALRAAIAAYWRGRERTQQDAERWRARLLDDDAALTAWIVAHPQTAVQPLRALIRNARRERTAQQATAGQPDAAASGTCARELLLALRAQLQQDAGG